MGLLPYPWAHFSDPRIPLIWDFFKKKGEQSEEEKSEIIPQGSHSRRANLGPSTSPESHLRKKHKRKEEAKAMLRGKKD